MIEIACRIDEPGHFLRAEHEGQPSGRFGKMECARSENAGVGFDIQEAQCGYILTDASRRQLFALKQIRLVLAAVFRPELVRRSVEKRCEIADDLDVGFCGKMGIVTSPSF